MYDVYFNVIVDIYAGVTYRRITETRPGRVENLHTLQTRRLFPTY